MNRLLRSLLAVAAATLVAGSPTAAASCNGNGHDIGLWGGTASPGTGTTSTAITFSFHYADTGACAPDAIGMTIPGVGTFGGFVRSGSDYRAGVVFSRTITLPAGTHAYAFSATSGRKSATLSNVSPSRVVISAPAPAPTPPPPPPTTQPAPPAPSQQPAPATTAPAPTATPEPTSTPASSPTQTAAPTASPPPESTGGWWVALQARPDLEWRPAASDPVAQLIPELPDGFGEIPGLEFLGPVLAYGVATAGGLGMFFLLLRRRSNEPARPPLVAATVAGAAAATPAPGVPAAAADPSDSSGIRLDLRPMRDLVPPLDPELLRDPDGPTGPAPSEVGIPRWLRPSVRQARFGEVQRRRDWGD